MSITDLLSVERWLLASTWSEENPTGHQRYFYSTDADVFWAKLALRGSSGGASDRAAVAVVS